MVVCLSILARHNYYYISALIKVYTSTTGN